MTSQGVSTNPHPNQVSLPDSNHETSAHPFEQLDDRQFDVMLYNMLLLLEATRKRLHEKNVVIESLHDSFRNERNGMTHQIWVLKLELEAERRKEKGTDKIPREGVAQLHKLEGGSVQAYESVQKQPGAASRRKQYQGA
jgi:hypothetical protein